MTNMSRRSFIKTGATAIAGTFAASSFLPKGWPALADEKSGGYFEKEFGVSDELCRKVLSEALSKGGDFADLFF